MQDCVRKYQACLKYSHNAHRLIEGRVRRHCVHRFRMCTAAIYVTYTVSQNEEMVFVVIQNIFNAEYQCAREQ